MADNRGPPFTTTAARNRRGSHGQQPQLEEEITAARNRRGQQPPEEEMQVHQINTNMNDDVSSIEMSNLTDYHPELSRIINTVQQQQQNSGGSVGTVVVVMDNSGNYTNRNNNNNYNHTRRHAQQPQKGRYLPASDPSGRPASRQLSRAKSQWNRPVGGHRHGTMAARLHQQYYAEEDDDDDEIGTGASIVSSGGGGGGTGGVWDDSEYYDIKNSKMGGVSKAKKKKPQDDPAYEDLLGDGRQYWRDIILGVNDGLVSTFLLISGVVGGDLTSTDILLTALAGTIAGAISMAAGEHVATKTQTEVMDGEIALEKKHISLNHEMELEELKEAFANIGIPADDDSDEVMELRERLINYYRKNNGAHLLSHVVLELGVVEDERRNPYIAGGVAFFLFLAGAAPSFIPFLLPLEIKDAFIVSGVCTTIGLVCVGAVKTWATCGNWFTAALENTIIAIGGGAAAFKFHCFAGSLERALKSWWVKTFRQEDID